MAGYLPANAVRAIVGLASIALFTRLLTPGDYGTYALAFSAMSLAHTMFFTWIEAAMARFWVGAQEAGTLSDHLAALYRIWFGVSLAFVGLCALAMLFWPSHGGARLALVAGICAIGSRSLIKLAQERRRAAGAIGAAARLDLTLSVGGFALGLAFIVLGARGAGVIAGMGAIAAVALIWVLPTELKPMAGGRFEPARARAYFAYGAPVAASLIMMAVLATADRFLLAAFLGREAVGAYHAGYSMAGRTLDVIFIWLGMAGGPAMVAALERGGRAALEETAREQFAAMIALALPAAVGLTLVARPLAEVVVGPLLSARAAEVATWIAPAAFLSGITTYYFNLAFTLGRRTGLLALTLAGAAGTNIAFNLVLIPRYGLEGALWATVASFALGAAASLIVGRRALPLPLPLPVVAKASAASLAMIAAVLAVPAMGGAGELISKTASGAAVYGLAAFALDLAGLRAVVRRALGRCGDLVTNAAGRP
ncbi:MAG: lipopolysaccharide biosynthesis protein [Caulobacteraceae bacterium]